MELKTQIDALGTAFEDFKKTNDAKLAEIKATGAATAATLEKLEKTEAAIQKLEGSIETLSKAAGRTGFGSENVSDEVKASREFKAGQEKYQTELKNWMRKGVDVTPEAREWFKKTMTVDSDQDGGFLVSPEMSSEVSKKVFESSPIRELASVQTISTSALEMLYDGDEAGSGWVGETSPRPETASPTIKKLVFQAHELYANPKASQTLLDDAAINVESWLADKIAEKFARDEATAFIAGDGNHKPKGILAYASGTGFGQIERKETAANNAITGDELIDLQSMLKEPFQNNATWLMNRTMISVFRKLKDVTSGQYLWQPGLAVGAPATLLGRPVCMASDLAGTVTAGADSIIYGDIKAGYQIVDRVGIRVLRDPYTAKPFVMFYTTKRVGGGVKNFEAMKVLKVKA